MTEAYILLAYILAYIGLFATSFYIINMARHYKKKVFSPNDDKTVSIIIPAYNEEKSIAKTIRSALSLDYPIRKIEIIVVDDGSKDDTYKIAKQFENSKFMVRVFTKQNGGKGSALNFGIRKSKSEIIVSMDADTFVSPNSLKIMIGHFYTKDVTAVTPSMAVYKPKGILQRVQQIEYAMGVFLRKSFSILDSIHVTPGAFSAYRRSFFLKYGGYDEKNITEDLEICLRIQSHNLIVENAPTAAIYTLVPTTFMALMYQRRRWYTGLIKNLWEYRKLFSPRYGSMGMVVLPVAVTTVVLSVILTSYLLINSLSNLIDGLDYLKAVNFKFGSVLEVNSFVFEHFFFTLFSHKLFLITILFFFILGFYIYFSKRMMRYREGVGLSFFFFIIFYSFLFAFWWIISFIYVILKKEVKWRENRDVSKKKSSD